MDPIIFGFADIFPMKDANEVADHMRDYKCADVLEAAGVQLVIPKQF